jgi:hypothetical protein
MSLSLSPHPLESGGRNQPRAAPHLPKRADRQPVKRPKDQATAETAETALPTNCNTLRSLHGALLSVAGFPAASPCFWGCIMQGHEQHPLCVKTDEMPPIQTHGRRQTHYRGSAPGTLSPQAHADASLVGPLASHQFGTAPSPILCSLPRRPQIVRCVKLPLSVVSDRQRG